MTNDSDKDYKIVLLHEEEGSVDIPDIFCEMLKRSLLRAEGKIDSMHNNSKRRRFYKRIKGKK